MHLRKKSIYPRRKEMPEEMVVKIFKLVNVNKIVEFKAK